MELTVETFGRLDVLVNNAGTFLVGPIEGLGAAEIDRTLAVNVRAPFVASQAAARHMGEGGRIVSIGSNVAERAVFPGLAPAVPEGPVHEDLLAVTTPAGRPPTRPAGPSATPGW